MENNKTQRLYRVEGMHCASCSVLINKVLGGQEGVESANVSFGAEKLTITFDSNKITEEKIHELVKSLGYTLIDEKEKSPEEIKEGKKRHIRILRNRTIISFVLASPIIVYYMAVHMFNLQHVHALIVGNFFIDLNWVYLFMTIPIQFWVASIFYKSAWTAFRVGSTSMDTLVVLGTSAAFFYSFIGFVFATTFGEYQTFWNGLDHPFWESSAALISFLILGRYLEAVSKGRVSDAIGKLLDLSPKKAIIIDKAGNEKEVLVKNLKVGDIFIVKPGMQIPTDGIVIGGESAVDEKIVTGESMPVSKKSGDEVIGATVNTLGRLKCKATKVGKDTLLHQIVNLVREAQATRAPLQRTADWISERFVPSVMILSIIAFNYWFFLQGNSFTPSLLFLVAVLVVSCPCALGLATPIATMVGTAKAAEYGILIKGGEALEKAHKMTTIAFDKTGTLTKGEPSVTDIVMFTEKYTEDEVIKIAAIAEKGSEHPLATAMIKKAKEKNIKIPDAENFKAVSGKGVRAEYGGDKILIGNKLFMEENKIDIKNFEKDVVRLSKEAKTVIYLALNNKILSIFALADTLKKYAKQAVHELKRRGIKVVMITGDNKETAHAIAEQLGIDEVYANILPEKKEELIESIQAKKEIVAMVGDGINDSPALAKSDLGIAVGSGTDVAIETGEIILIKDDLRDVVTAIDLSRKTIIKIWQNFFWAFIYNIIAIPVAAGLHLVLTQNAGDAAQWVLSVGDFFSALPNYGPVIRSIWVNLSQTALRPEIAGFAMAFSSVSVVLNSLLLRRYKGPKFQEAKI